MILIAAVVMTFLIIVFGAGAYWMVSTSDGPTGPKATKTPPTSTSRIPVRVIDPLGGENEDSLEDLIASWETEEKEINASTVVDVKVMSTDAEEAELAVSAAKLSESQQRAFEPRPGEKGVGPPGLPFQKSFLATA